MSHQSATPSGSTDLVSDQERPSIETSPGAAPPNAKYASLPTDEHATSFEAPTASWFYRITLDTWIPETLALLISVASMIAIAAILEYYDNTKSPQLPYGITLNAIVSILATVSRSMLIFTVSMCVGHLKWCWYHKRKRKVEDMQTMDAASRGPMGSIKLLVMLRARPLASLGAVITILALAFDPFVQQILQYSSIPSIDRDKESSVIRSPNFTIEPTSVTWLNAIGAGIWSGAARFAQQPSCPSGNCKWEKYQSTGWCSKCQDATSYAKIVDCDLDADYLDIDRLNHTGSCSVGFGRGSKFQVLGPYWTDFESLNQHSAATPVNRSDIVRSAVWPLSLLHYDLSLPLDNKTYAGVTNPILALGMVHVERCDDSALDKGLCITFAEECVLILCTRQFETSITNGTTDMTSADEDFGCLFQIHTDGGYTLDHVDTHCWQAGAQCADLRFTNTTSFRREDYARSEYCSEGIVVEGPLSQSAPFGTPLASDVMALPHVQGKLLSRLTGNQTAILTTNPGASEGAIVDSSYTMEYIAANGLGPVLTGVAASLTQQALLANTSEKVVGTVWSTVTYVAVDWPWLVYPATLVLGAIILLVLTAVHSHRCGVEIWKSSMLPLLYRSLDPELLARQRVLQSVSTMAGVASGAKVTLVETAREDKVVLTQ